MPVFSLEDKTTLSHFIVGAVMFQYDPKVGIFVSCLGVTDTGSPTLCSLTPDFFVDDDPSSRLLTAPSSSFRSKGLGTFLLATLQVLGHIGLKKTRVAKSASFPVYFNEIRELPAAPHHLYLQARVDWGSAYIMYVLMGFKSAATVNDKYRCTSYHQDCPVNRSNKSQGVEDGYLTDDPALRLLVLKKWIMNVYPVIDDPSSLEVVPAPHIWNSIGLSDTEYLTSALIPPLNSTITRELTTVAYDQLLECRKHIAMQPLRLVELQDPFTVASIPTDRTLDAGNPDLPERRMIVGLEVPRWDIRRFLFRSLHLKLGSPHSDACEVIAACLYTEGHLATDDDFVDDTQYSPIEMALELRLNLIAFYLRCAHFRFTSDILDAWSSNVVEEFQYAETKSLLPTLGLNGFRGDLESITAEPVLWQANFRLLASRLQSQRPRPFMWADVSAIQLLFSVKAEPVYFARVYGCAFTDTVTSHRLVYPHVPLLSSLRQIDGNALPSLPASFTVVPVLALDTFNFGSFSCANARNQKWEAIRSHLTDDSAMTPSTLNRFRRRPILRVVVGTSGIESPRAFQKGYCASNSLCHMIDNPDIPAADKTAHCCPGCGEGVHAVCGYVNTALEDPIDRTTCHRCFIKTGEVFNGRDDSLFIRGCNSQKQDKKQKKKPAPDQNKAGPHDNGPHDNTRGSNPTDSLSDDNKRLKTPPTKSLSEREHRQLEARERLITQQNPSYMYPKEESTGTRTLQDPSSQIWWRGDELGELLGGITGNRNHLAEAPVESHTYSREEMTLFSKKMTANTPAGELKRKYKDILRGALAMRNFLIRSKNWVGDTDRTPFPSHLHRVNFPFTNQDLVNLACFLDRGRGFSVDTQFDTKNKSEFSIRVDSYEIEEEHKLSYHLKSKGKSPSSCPLVMRIYRSWTKKYLDWFDPALFEYVETNTDGLQVTRLEDRLADDDDVMYGMRGKQVHDKLLVPLSKMHKVVTTKHEFGIQKDGEFFPYCKDTYATDHGLSQAVRHPSYDTELTESCNPKGFEYVPVARMPTTKIPEHRIQIKAIRADIQTTGEITVTRWLGLQGGKYVTLPTEWVEHNFDRLIREEAIERAENHMAGRDVTYRWLAVPPGDSRDDDPPVDIRHNQGPNYYYQGQEDNCVMGGLANAVFWMLGPDESDQLLQNFSPTITKFWEDFSKHVNQVMTEYLLKKVECNNVLTMDDSCPVVVQQLSGDKSESHAICIYKGCIYDSASQFVLEKTVAALNWSCGAYGFEDHLRLYWFTPKDVDPTSHNKEKKKRKRRAK